MTTSVGISPSPILSFTNNAGQPNAGGTLLTQVGGVNYPTYQDSGGSTPLPNPIPLNSRGEISNAAGTSCQLFLVTGVAYTFTLYDVNGNQLNQSTHVYGGPSGSPFYADAGGTSDAITASYTVPSASLVDGYTLWLDIATPNATTTPTFAPTLNGALQTAHTIVKNVGNAEVALAIGDLQGVVTLTYDLANTVWRLQNPNTVPNATNAIALTQGTRGYTLTAEQITTSGTLVDFTGIPTWVTKIWVMFNSVSTNGTSALTLLIGPSGGVETTGYLGASGAITGANSTVSGVLGVGFTFDSFGSAASTRSGEIILTLQNAAAFRWACNGMIGYSDSGKIGMVTGVKSCASALSRIRITSANGTDTFDNGSISIAYE